MDKQTDDPSLIFIHDDFQQQDFKETGDHLPTFRQTLLILKESKSRLPGLPTR